MSVRRSMALRPLSPSTLHSPGPTQPLPSDPVDTLPREHRASRFDSASDPSDLESAVAGDAKRQRVSDGEEVDTTTTTTGTERHVFGVPSARPAPPSVSRQHPSSPVDLPAHGPVLAAPDRADTSQIWSGLRARARQFLRHPDGKFDASPLKLLNEIIDGALVDAADAVEAAVQELPAGRARPSGRAQRRLLAWVLADARGSAPLEPAVAETAGKRLQKQAERVRGKLADVAAAAAAARVEACAATDAEARLAAIDEDELFKEAALRAEVYVGFYEVAELPAPVEPELPADDRARSDGCASIDEPATRALVLRALGRNLDLELEATRLREKMEQYRADYEGYCSNLELKKRSLYVELGEMEYANEQLQGKLDERVSSSERRERESERESSRG